MLEDSLWKKLAVLALFIFVASSLYTNYHVLRLTTATHSSAVAIEEIAKRNSELNISNNKALKNTERSVQILEDATSPESKAASDARLAEAIKRLDCNGQRTVQRAVDALSEGGRTSVMTPQCVQYFIDNPQL